MSKKLKWRVEILLIRFFGALPFAVSRLFASLIAAALWYGKSNTHRITTININLCFPELDQQARNKLIKQSLLESVRTGLEMPMAWLKKPAVNFAHIKNIIGKELVDEAINNKKGVIILIPHLGNWEYLGDYLGQAFKATYLYKPPKNPYLSDIMMHGRTATGAKVVPTNTKGVAVLLKTLKSTGVVGILPDQVPDDDNGREFADFYSYKVSTMTLISKLLQRTNSVAIACFAKRLPKGGFEIIHKEVDPLLYSDDMQQSAIGLNKTVEQLVSLAPAQYQWEYKRFRKGPDGQRKIYDRKSR
jgi:KDO2-lipid IV(A) lauroyltransferase